MNRKALLLTILLSSVAVGTEAAVTPSATTNIENEPELPKAFDPNSLSPQKRLIESIRRQCSVNLLESEEKIKNNMDTILFCINKNFIVLDDQNFIHKLLTGRIFSKIFSEYKDNLEKEVYIYKLNEISREGHEFSHQTADVISKAEKEINKEDIDRIRAIETIRIEEMKKFREEKRKKITEEIDRKKNKTEQ